ncbi:FAD-dependent oxidoreductase [Aeromonas simiae]|nr:FAD-dependent oxidoreductase [Aeromonas simiae]
MSRPLDMTLPPDLSRKTGTGPVLSRVPRWRPALPPCNHACPAGEDIQAWLSLAQSGQFEAAWRRLIEVNPLPAVHGRVCYHPCEHACNRAEVDEAVSIHAIERFLGDEALRLGWLPAPPPAPTGKRVLVVGAGPSGLSCAWHLNRLGHSVEIREAGPRPGGMLRFGIPAYRLPRAVLDGEVARMLAAGVQLTLNHKVEDVLAEWREGGFDAVFMAIGAHLAKRVDIPAREAGRILDAVSFLQQASLAQEQGLRPPELGRRVAIYGGGNTAMDAARTARRLGAEEAMIIYRRDRDHMPAHDFEAIEAEEEGITINWLRSIRQFDSDCLEVEVMTLDEQGQPQPTGRFETLEADALILAPRPGGGLERAQERARCALEWRGGAGGREPDDRSAGPVCRRRHGSLRAHRDGGHWPRQEGGAPHRRLAARRALLQAPLLPAGGDRLLAALVPDLGAGERSVGAGTGVAPRF